MTRHVSPLPFPAGSDPGAVAGLVTMLTLGTAFALAALGVDWFWVAFPVGFGGVMPIAVGAAKRRGHERTRPNGRRRGWDTRRHDQRIDRFLRADDEDAALARLRERYASGELDEAAFESRLERLLLTEDTDSAREYAAGRAQDPEEVDVPVGSDTPDRVNAD